MTTAHASDEQWEHALSDCEARIDAAAAGLAAGASVAVPAFAAPTIEGPVPSALEPRARALIERGVDLERQLGTKRDTVRAELRRLPRMPPAQSDWHLDIKA